MINNNILFLVLFYSFCCPVLHLQGYKEAHPDCGKSASLFSDQYNKLIIEAMGGSGDNDLEKENKIIHIISKNVIIDKE